MTALGNILPALPAAGEDARRERTDRFNQAILRMPVTGAADTILASPCWARACTINLIDRLFLARTARRGEGHCQAQATIAASGFKLRKGTQTLDSRCGDPGAREGTCAVLLRRLPPVPAPAARGGLSYSGSRMPRRRYAVTGANK